MDIDPRLDLALEAAQLGIWDWDLVSGALTWSARVRDIHGFSADEPITLDKVRSRTHPEDLPRTSEMARRARDPLIRERAAMEYRVVRPDGSIRWVLAHGEAAFAVVDGTEQAVRYTGTMQDITERKLAEHRTAESESRLRLALDAAAMGVWEFDVATDAFVSSPELNRIMGFDPDRPLDREVMRTRYYPGDSEKFAAAAAAALAQGERRVQSEFRFFWPDGQMRWLLVRAEIFIDAEGKPARALGVILDITDRKQAEEHQRLLMLELEHRVKNLLATIQAMTAQSFRHAGSLTEAERSLTGRLLTLAQAHAILRHDGWRRADLGEVAAATARPFREGDESRVSIAGPKVDLESRMVVSVALVLNELFTNAVKHGALSNDRGRIDLAWELLPDGAGLVLTWRESGGPPVAMPGRQGFGTRFIERSLGGSADADVKLDFAPTGLVATIRLRLEEAMPTTV